MRRFIVGLLMAVLPVAGAVGQTIQGLAPDWHQPYAYGPPLSAGPGPNPSVGPDPFDAWSAPTAAANLLGHWEDVRGVPVGDGTPAPGTTVGYGGGASWHDYQLDANRPGPGIAPAVPTDLGWYMDTNNSGDVARGNGSDGHVGTYVKDIQPGLQTFLDTVSSGWTTATRGATIAQGTDVFGNPVTPHADADSAFAEIVSEIDHNRTVLMTWKHWDIEWTGWSTGCGGICPPREAPDSFYSFGDAAGGDPWGNDESWVGSQNPETALGHTVTVVGYMPDWGDPGILTDENGQSIQSNWVIVHDNVGDTPRNVAVPLRDEEFATVWLANTTAVPEPATALLLLSGLALTRRRR
jgi:hypothetical protein